MEAVICYCLNCNQELGRFRNSWNGIGKNFYSPVYPMLTYTHGFEAFGEVYPGPVDTPLEHSLLQNLRCKACESVVGTQCDSAPQGHMLAKDQQILKRQSISVVSESTGMAVNLAVTKSVIVLTEDVARKSSSSRRAATAQPTGRQKIKNNHWYDGVAPQISNMRPLPVKDTDISDIADFRSWVQDAIDLQKIDINRVSGTLNKVEGEMQLFRNFMKEVRTELQQNQVMRDDYNQDRRKITQLVQDANELEKKVRDVGNVEGNRGLSGESLSRDIEIIVSDMQQISDKVNEVEDVKAGLLHISKQFKGFEKITTDFVASSQTHGEARDLVDMKRQLGELHDRLNFFERAVHNDPAITGNTANPSHTATENVQDVALATAMATKFDRSIAERARKTRLVPRVEIFVPAQVTVANQIERPRSSLGISRGETLISDLGEGSFRPKTASLKRKHDLVEQPVVTVDEQNDSELSLPKKRGRPSRATIDAQQTDMNMGAYFLAPVSSTKGRPIEIFSSERGKSPATPHQDEVAPDSARTTKVPTKWPAPAAPPKAKLNAEVVMSEPVARRASLRKVSSASNLASSATLVNQEKPRQRRMSHNNSGNIGDENELFSTVNGKIDRRSLRLKIQNNETPRGQQERRFVSNPHSGAKGAEKSAPKSSTKRPSTSSDAVIPSIELEQQEHSHRATRSSEQSVLHPLPPIPKAAQTGNFESTSTPASTRARPSFKCDVCSMIFAFVGGLNYHKRKSNCYENGVENYKGVKKAELEAREKLVRETLDREMARM